MPSRPVLIGRGLVTHIPTHPEPHASTTQNLNQQTPPQNTGPKGLTTRTQQNNGSPRYGGHSGRETPGPIPNPEVKPASANGTAPDRMWESRTPPNNYDTRGHPRGGPLCYFASFSCDVLRPVCSPQDPFPHPFPPVAPPVVAQVVALLEAGPRR
jgi:hypothetical protein